MFIAKGRVNSCLLIWPQKTFQSCWKICLQMNARRLFQEWNVFPVLPQLQPAAKPWTDKLAILPSLQNQPHSKSIRHGCVGQPSPRYVLHWHINTITAKWTKNASTSYMASPGHVNAKNEWLGKIGTVYPRPVLWCYLWGFNWGYNLNDKNER